MRLVPLSLRQANALVEQLHRHHKPARGGRFFSGCMVEDRLVGAAIVSRPVGREIDQWKVAEVVRLVTDGTPNACSFLYGATARIAKAMGFERIQTYILASEPGTSLKAAGWTFSHMTDGRNWNTKARGGRREDQPMEDKQCWVKVLKAPRKEVDGHG